jgi:uncharacterized protein YlxW (UPF0749 family)
MHALGCVLGPHCSLIYNILYYTPTPTPTPTQSVCITTTTCTWRRLCVMVLSGQSLQDQVTEWRGLEELCAAEISLLDLFCNLQGRHSRQPQRVRASQSSTQ